MTIHVLPPLPDAGDPPGSSESSESSESSGALDPFWAAVRRRRPDLPLVLLDDPRGSVDGLASGSEAGR